MPLGAERVRVKTAVVVPVSASATVVSAMVREGTGSLSKMVRVVIGVPVALVAPVISRPIVSLISSRLSSMIETVKVWRVRPGAK